MNFVKIQSDEERALDGNPCIPFFAHVPYTLEAARPFDERLVTSGLGRLLYERRRKLGLSQVDVGKQFGVDRQSIRKWETGSEPSAKYMPAIIAFLGTDDWIPQDTFPDRVRWFRMQMGLTQEEAAQALGCAKKTVYKWEAGQVLSPTLQDEIERRFAQLLWPECQKRSA